MQAMTDAERWGTAAVATVVFFAWYRTTGASETTKRIAVTAWTLFWFTVPWLFSGVSVDPIALLIGVGLIVAGGFLRGTPAAPYFRAFVGAFLVVMLALSVGDCVLHPTSWCPAPMHIDAQGICRQP
jgi:hypothetical protein